MVIAIEFLFIVGFWALAWRHLQRARASGPDASSSRVKKDVTLALGRTHVLFRLLRVDDHISLWNVGVCVFLIGFFPIAVLSLIEQLRFPGSPSLTFFGAVADPLNCAILVPAFVAAATAFLRSVPKWVHDFHDNLLAENRSSEAQKAFDDWVTGLRDSRAWSFACSWPINVFAFAVCTVFPWWHYWETAQRRELYGFAAGMTFLGGYVTFFLGLITYGVVVTMFFGTWMLWRFQRAYRRFEQYLQVNPFHPDGSGGMLFAGQMAERLGWAIFLAALMVLALILRDRAVGVSLRWHVWAPALFGIVLAIWGPAVVATHLVLVRAREKWLESLRAKLPTRPTADAGIAAVIEWAEQSKHLKDLFQDYPTWPTNLRHGITFGLSLVGAVFLALVSGGQIPLKFW
jgi:hypothetical protein